SLSPEELVRAARLRRPDRPAVAPPHPFVATAVEHGSARRQVIARAIFMTMSFALVVPVVAILVYLFVKAWPILSLGFLFQNPTNRMTAGGIWAPLIGTFFLIMLSL